MLTIRIPPSFTQSWFSLSFLGIVITMNTFYMVVSK